MIRSNVCTIPASAPFLATLVEALINGRLIDGFAPGGDPLALARATLYLPTRRAGAMARDAFLGALRTEAAILPRVVALGDIDEDEFVFAEAAGGPALRLPPALEPLERRLLLAKLVLAWADQLAFATAGTPHLVVNTPAAALALADELARLIDDMTTRGISWSALDQLVPEQYDEYWQITLRFLKIAREAWPQLLAERGAIDAAARRDLLIEAEAARLAAHDGPVIVAGSTGSMPATAKLIATVARLPHGAVVLPGLDTDLDARSWDAIGGNDGGSPCAGHPQFAMHGLLERIGIARTDVRTLASPAPHGRERLLSEVLRPAETTEHWQLRLHEPGFKNHVAGALRDLVVIDAANAEEESLAIAVALREAVSDGRSAALVTPDRDLARRVAAALGRWAITACDSAGTAIVDTPAGVFARLVVGAALGGLEPVDLLALLKHPHFRLRAAAGAHGRAIDALERAVLRGPRPRAGSAGLAHALCSVAAAITALQRGEESELHRADPRASIAAADLAAAQMLVAALSQALAPLEQLERGKKTSFAAMSVAHQATIAALSTDADGSTSAFEGPDGHALAQALEEIAGQARSMAIGLDDYLELFATTLAGRVARPPEAGSASVRIFGPLEARLTGCQCVVLGGLVEGTWPPDVRSDPWLSRPMRQQLGLDLPERRIGLSAHDFAQLMNAPRVVLTRATKLSGAPTVASRFMQRLAAVVGAEDWAALGAKGETYLEWVRSLDRPAEVKPAKRPEPRPPRNSRPKTLSVTEIEHWLRDPYTIYAKHILKLPRLAAVDTSVGAANRGIAIHGAIGDFSKQFADRMPVDPLATLLMLGKRQFSALDDFPEAKTFWWPRFMRIADWFIDWETKRRANVVRVLAETRGTLEIALADGEPFRLSARADRIEQRADGSYAVVDFKTGLAPSDKQVRIGLAPQLTLEAAILRHGRFADVAPNATVAELAYVKLKGGEPAGEECVIDLKDNSADAAADEALTKLSALVQCFDDPTTPYRSLVLSMWSNRYGTYDDLARVKEWSVGAEPGE